jgi:flagellar protein FliS
MTTKKILNAYKNANRDAVVESEDPQALIMILLDELLRAMRSYANLVEKDKSNEARKNNHFTRSLTMLYGLQSSLNFDEGGEVAENLFRLYEYARVQLLNTSQTGQIDGTQVAISALTDIREAWSIMDPKNEIQNVG